MDISIRLMQGDESDAVASLWHRAKHAAYPYISIEQDTRLSRNLELFHRLIMPRCKIWVAHHGAALGGFIAMNDSYIDRLYIDPMQQRRGIGSALLEHARRLCPDGLELHTHQKNTSACAFYENHGFAPVKYGISPAPELEPDVEYRWRPD